MSGAGGGREECIGIWQWILGLWNVLYYTVMDIQHYTFDKTHRIVQHKDWIVIWTMEFSKIYHTNTICK